MFDEMVGGTHTGLEEDVRGATFKISKFRTSKTRAWALHGPCRLQAVSLDLGLYHLLVPVFNVVAEPEAEASRHGPEFVGQPRWKCLSETP